ncbi:MULTISPECIES: DUF3060 domain-containing protein [Brevibacterium]|uniref:DUF3060 domain-containing protein n=1 Tax=Brevibacterium salitolerans TaxID=1403566 RepID=A0ABN2WKD6_9MICO|nr:DUF3060 domain-containing protein [Brevibacterium sp.]
MTTVHCRSSRIRKTVPLLFLAGVLTVSGCSVSITEGGDADGTVEGSGSPSGPAEENSDSGSAATEDSVDAEVSATGDDIAEQAVEGTSGFAETDQDFDREELRGAATTALTCSSSLTVGEGYVGQLVSVTGDCSDLSVSGTGIVVVAEAVSSLVVEGSGTVVLVDTAESVSVSGQGNAVMWGSGDPAVSDSGTANVARQG